jgi:nicotinate-nucleotide adenylyltransferase
VYTPMMNISSSFIRQAIAEGKDVPFFLHEKVYQQIKKKRFYEKCYDSVSTVLKK